MDTINNAHHSQYDLAAIKMWGLFWPDLEYPNVIITNHRQPNVKGYFSSRLMTTHDNSINAYEIAINPAYTLERSHESVISTLAHELCHLWQHIHGKPGRTGYHNKEWYNEMIRIGLQPLSANGKGTGDKVTHKVVSGGMFDTWYRALEWQYKVFGDAPFTTPDKPKKAVSKVKYTCPKCEQNAWAKPSARLLCGDCSTEDYLVEMLSED